MVATAQRPISPLSATPRRTGAGAEAQSLAMGYLRYVSAYWRGDERAAIFPLRLGAYWRPDLPPVPPTAPAAVSPHGGGGRGIAWYQTGDEVLDYVRGAHGGYQVPFAAIPRLARCSPIGP